MRVLVVDDEPQVRRAVVRILRLVLGRPLEIEQAADAPDACAKLASGADLVMTDHRLGAGTSREVVAAARARGVRAVLVMSGTAAPGDVDAPLLSKPFTRDELAAALAGLGLGVA